LFWFDLQHNAKSGNDMMIMVDVNEGQ